MLGGGEGGGVQKLFIYIVVFEYYFSLNGDVLCVVGINATTQRIILVFMCTYVRP